MLKQRIITALILVAILLAALTADNTVFWRALIAVVVFVGFWEWLRFCKITNITKQVPCFIIFTVSFYFIQSGFLPIFWLCLMTCALWLLLLIFTFKNLPSLIHNQLIKLLVGIWTLSAAGYFVIELNELQHGVLWVLCLLLAIFAADIGAYFCGRRFGKNKLAPSISPGKTIEGLIGGQLLVLVIFIPILVSNFDLKQASLLLLTILITALVSVGGDLFESKMKRYVDLKDSSQILPGHGGILDRIDSLLAGIPFFILGLLLLDFIH